MTAIAPVVTLSPRDYDAVLFDLDGVLTKRRACSVGVLNLSTLFSSSVPRTGEAFIPFDINADYRRYVDGKPRYDGVASFLKARK